MKRRKILREAVAILHNEANNINRLERESQGYPGEGTICVLCVVRNKYKKQTNIG